MSIEKSVQVRFNVGVNHDLILEILLNDHDHYICIQVVYVARNPKDVIVSYHHHHQLTKLGNNFTGTVTEFAQLVLDDQSTLSSTYDGHHQTHSARVKQWTRLVVVANRVHIEQSPLPPQHCLPFETTDRKGFIALLQFPIRLISPTCSKPGSCAITRTCSSFSTRISNRFDPRFLMARNKRPG